MASYILNLSVSENASDDKVQIFKGTDFSHLLLEVLEDTE